MTNERSPKIGDKHWRFASSKKETRTNHQTIDWYLSPPSHASCWNISSTVKKNNNILTSTESCVTTNMGTGRNARVKPNCCQRFKKSPHQQPRDNKWTSNCLTSPKSCTCSNADFWAFRCGSQTIDAYSVVGRIMVLYVSSFTGMVQSFKFLLTKPRVLLALHTMFCACVSHDCSYVMVTLRSESDSE